MTPLMLIALDDADLAVMSAHLQDAVVRVGDMAYLPRHKRFATVLNRFDWMTVATSGGKSDEVLRRRSGLRFERVLAARLSGIDLKSQNSFLSLLAITMTRAGEADPGGRVRLDFSGGAAIELDVECIEAELKDLGAAWRAKRRPVHEDDDGQGRRGSS
ncbi:MAG: DUF2948 family protein [Hyphomicrobiaceae bacterium]|nr:DUF2948 family protein [Hyphomicrobiaceae bacterium]